MQLADEEEDSEEPKLLTPSDVLDMAAYLEIDTVDEIWLFPLARDAVLAELPDGWVEKLDENECASVATLRAASPRTTR